MNNFSLREKINSIIFFLLSVFFGYFIAFKPDFNIGIGDFKINITFFILLFLVLINIKEIINSGLKKIILLFFEISLIIFSYSINSSGFGSLGTVLALIFTLIITPILGVNKKLLKITFFIHLFFWCYSLSINYYTTLFLNPNNAASIPFHFCLLLVSYINMFNYKKNVKLLSSIAIIIMTLINISKYDCRTCSIMLIILLMLVLLNYFKKEYEIKPIIIWFLMTVFSLIVIYVYIWLYKNNIAIDINSVVESDKSFFSGRQNIWMNMLEILKSNWLFGIGSKSIYFPSSTHNYMLNVLVLFGLPHFLFFIANIYNYVKSICLYKINNANFICLISILALFITEYFESSFIGGNKFSILLFLSIIYFNSNNSEAAKL